MYTFEDFINKLRIRYNDLGKRFNYKYYPEDNELWVNDRYIYLKITDDEIIMRVNKNFYEINAIVSKFKDLDTQSIYRDWVVYKFKYYLNDAYNSLIKSVPDELINRLNNVIKPILHRKFEDPLDYYKFFKYENDIQVFYEINLHRDEDGFYYYTIRASNNIYNDLGPGYELIYNLKCKTIKHAAVKYIYSI